MTEVVFISGLADKLAYASRLLRKKHREGERVAVFGPPALLNRLDLLLWTEPEREFLPHLRLRAGQAPSDMQRRHTGLWLLEAPDPGLQCGTAVHLGELPVAQLAGFERVAELIGDDPAEAQVGRQRWREHAARGCSISHHPQKP
jgi:DNA polymerase III subunit chi